jgi:hypothetical protein
MRRSGAPESGEGETSERVSNPWRIAALTGDRRQVRRIGCHSSAAFRECQRKAVDVTIDNLSTHGCAVRHAGSQVVGARCWIALPSLESWEARIAWASDTHHGLAFSRPLHRAVAEMFIARRNGRLPWGAAD